MLLEQITTDYEDDDNQQPAPKGMVRTEMGRLVKKADQDAWMKKETAAMQAQLKSRGASSLKEKKVGAALKGMKLTPKRTMEVADSLDFEARKKVYSKINKTTKINDSGDIRKENKSREEYDTKAAKEFKKNPDMINSKKYRGLALKAMNKNK
jgi:hypothetical protein